MKITNIRSEDLVEIIINNNIISVNDIMLINNNITSEITICFLYIMCFICLIVIKHIS